MRISGFGFDLEREPLQRAFRFKGGAFTEKWIALTTLMDDEGFAATGMGGFAVLWSDPGVFFSRSETGGNLAMALLAEEAARNLVGAVATTPFDLVAGLVPELLAYARMLTRRPDLRRTFVLNSLVSLDFAFWALLARRSGSEDLHELLPPALQSVLPDRHSRIAHIPLLTQTSTAREIAGLADEGCFIFKIKLGAEGSQSDMLRRDGELLACVHSVLSDRETPHTRCGRPVYCLDETECTQASSSP
jgi:hypothetical protein